MKITLISLILIYFWRENSNIPKKSVKYENEVRLFGGISKHCAFFINSFSVMIYLISKQKKIYQKVWKNHMIVDINGVFGFFSTGE